MVNGKAGGASWGGVIVVGLILLIVGFIVFAPLVNLVVNFFRGGGSASLCTLSLFEGKGIARCPIDDVVIYPDKVEIKYGGQKKYELLAEKKTSTTNEMANEALAKMLLTCLGRGGGLNSRAFSRSRWFSSDIVCMECAQINVNVEAGTITELKGYLETNKPKGGISDKTYMDLLTKNQQHRQAYLDFGTRTELIPSNTESRFAPGDYTAFFVGIKKGSFSNWVGQKKYELLAEKKTSTTNEMANEALAKMLLTCLGRGGGLNSRAFSRSRWFSSDI